MKNYVRGNSLLVITPTTAKSRRKLRSFYIAILCLTYTTTFAQKKHTRPLLRPIEQPVIEADSTERSLIKLHCGGIDMKQMLALSSMNIEDIKLLLLTNGWIYNRRSADTAAEEYIVYGYTATDRETPALNFMEFTIHYPHYFKDRPPVQKPFVFTLMMTIDNAPKFFLRDIVRAGFEHRTADQDAASNYIRFAKDNTEMVLESKPKGGFYAVPQYKIVVIQYDN